MARFWLVPGGMAVTLVVLGPLFSRLEWVSPEVGFRLYFAGGALAALFAMAFGGAAALGTALGRAWRGTALRTATIPLLVAGISLASSWGRPTWPHHEVTTDLLDAPAFALGPAAGASVPEEVAAAQQRLFPSLAPIRLPVPHSEAVRWVESTARAMPDWEVVHVDATGLIQAVAVSRIFRFRDDVVIRVRPEGEGARVDLRSRSRVGQSDLGANAARILEFREALLGETAR